MANPGYPTIDQLKIFLAVVDEGSFNGAARKLNRAVSVISYGVANLKASWASPCSNVKGRGNPR